MTITIIGATGFLGGSIARALRDDGHAVTGAVRDAGKAALLEQAGIATIQASLDDPDSLARLVTTADVVIQAADSDHRAGTDALLAALAGTGKTLLHVSGISVTADSAAGHAGGAILAEDTPFTPIPQRAARYALDRAVQDAAGTGIRSMVICCPLVYGAPPWPGRESVQLPFLVADARKRGTALHVGPGENRWSHCHAADLGRFFAAAVQQGRAGALYYPEAGEIAWGTIARMIGERLSLPAGSWPLEEAERDWGPRARFSFSSNARTRGVAARADTGWHPVIAGIDAEIDRLASAT
jgi:nucleoside-diphosphate-sugar epimerase